MVRLNFYKKFKKLFFFQLFLHKIILFLYEIEFYMKNAFLWCIICWYKSKIAKFWNFTHFLAIFGKILNFCIFFCDLWKKNPQKTQISWKWSKLMWKQDFWPFGGSRAEKLPWVYVGQIDPPSPGNVIPDLSRNRVNITALCPDNAAECARACLKCKQTWRIVKCQL